MAASVSFNIRYHASIVGSREILKSRYRQFKLPSRLKFVRRLDCITTETAVKMQNGQIQSKNSQLLDCARSFDRILYRILARLPWSSLSGMIAIYSAVPL